MAKEEIELAPSVKKKRRIAKAHEILDSKIEKIEKQNRGTKAVDLYSFELPPLIESKSKIKNHIDWDLVKKLLILQASREDIAAVIGVTIITLMARCQKDFGITLTQLESMGREVGKNNLRRVLYEAAVIDNNTQAMIWLSKNWLGMSEKQEVKIKIEEWTTSWNTTTLVEPIDIIDVDFQEIPDDEITKK